MTIVPLLSSLLPLKSELDRTLVWGPTDPSFSRFPNVECLGWENKKRYTVRLVRTLKRLEVNEVEFFHRLLLQERFNITPDLFDFLHPRETLRVLRNTYTKLHPQLRFRNHTIVHGLFLSLYF